MGGGFRRPLSSAARRRQDTKPPSPGRHRAALPGRWEGRGAGGPLAPRAAAGASPKRTTGGPQTGGRPHPGGRATGGPRRGEVELGAGGARAQARPPTPRPGGRSQRPGHRHHGRAPPAGGCRPPVFGRPATRPDAGRPRAGGPAASHQPTPTAARAPGPGPDKAGPLRFGRIPFMFAPAGQTAPQGREPRTGTAGRRALRPAAWRHGRREVRTEAGAIPPGRGAASAAKKMPGGLPPGWTRLDEKKMRGGRFVPPACRYSGYQISPCSA